MTRVPFFPVVSFFITSWISQSHRVDLFLLKPVLTLLAISSMVCSVLGSVPQLCRPNPLLTFWNSRSLLFSFQEFLFVFYHSVLLVSEIINDFWNIPLQSALVAFTLIFTLPLSLSKFVSRSFLEVFLQSSVILNGSFILERHTWDQTSPCILINSWNVCLSYFRILKVSLEAGKPHLQGWSRTSFCCLLRTRCTSWSWVLMECIVGG